MNLKSCPVDFVYVIQEPCGNRSIEREYKDRQPLLPNVYVFVFVNFVLEAVQSKSLTSRKACWSLYSL